MEQFRETCLKSIDEGLLQVIISNPRKKDAAKKIKVRPIYLKGKLCYQQESYLNNQVFHANLSEEELAGRMVELAEGYKQFEIKSRKNDYICLISKKGKVNIKRRKNNMEDEEMDIEKFSHNRVKNYVLPQNKPVDFLVELGVMTAQGKVKDKKYDKFRQINRFLEFVEDIVDNLPRDREITILDFGCGKSYLTFAIYYYLHTVKGLDVNIIGLDLKRDVIKRCNELKDKLGYKKLKFITGDIADYDELDKVDMIFRSRNPE